MTRDPRTFVRAVCGVVVSVALFAIMILTLVDVAGRKFLSASIPGSLEVTELLLVMVIFGGLPLVALAGEHVVFDSLDPMLPPWVQRAQQAVVDVLCAAALAGLAYLMWVKGGRMTEYGDVTAQLRLPLGLFVKVMGVLIAVAAAAHLLLLGHQVAHHAPGVPERMDEDA